jgi:hypothetical protein
MVEMCLEISHFTDDSAEAQINRLRVRPKVTLGEL